MGTLKITKKIELDYNAHEWQLFSDMEGAEGAAKRLNDTIERYANAGMKKYETRSAVQSLMAELGKWGANDTEPRAVLERILEKFYE